MTDSKVVQLRKTESGEEMRYRSAGLAAEVQGGDLVGKCLAHLREEAAVCVRRCLVSNGSTTALARPEETSARSSESRTCSWTVRTPQRCTASCRASNLTSCSNRLSSGYAGSNEKVRQLRARSTHSVETRRARVVIWSARSRWMSVQTLHQQKSASSLRMRASITYAA